MIGSRVEIESVLMIGSRVAGGARMLSLKREIKAKRVFKTSKIKAGLVKHPSRKPAPLYTLIGRHRKMDLSKSGNN
jgi:hypothetical protein